MSVHEMITKPSASTRTKHKTARVHCV